MKNMLKWKRTGAGGLSLLFAVLLLMASSTAAYAWFVWREDAGGMHFLPGGMTTDMEAAAYDRKSGSWVTVRADRDEASAELDLGELTAINQEPEQYAYLRFRMTDASVPSYVWLLSVKDVSFSIGLRTGNSVNWELPDVPGYIKKEYYDESYRFLKAGHAVTADGQSDPASLTYSDASVISAADQPLVGETGEPLSVPAENWLVVRILPTLAGVQALVRDVPVQWMPYCVSIRMTFAGELRTLS